MSRESKVLVGVGALAVIGLVLAISGKLVVGFALIALGVIGGVVLLRLTRPDSSDPFAEARSEADQTNTGSLTPSEPLAPWSPQGGLDSWSPPVSAMPTAPPPMPVAETPPPAPVVESPSWDSAWDNDAAWDTPAATAQAPVETNPLDDLGDLDTLDPLAELERIEGRSAGSLDADPEFDVHGNPVNEDVSDADDIMAASQATELHLADGEQTELQKLLAKVQIRLSAYE